MYLFLFKLSRTNVRFIGLLMNSKYRGGALLFLKTVMNGLLQPGHFMATSLETSGFTADLKSAAAAAAPAAAANGNVSAAPSSSSSLEGLGRLVACFATCLACRGKTACDDTTRATWAGRRSKTDGGGGSAPSQQLATSGSL